MLNDFVKLSRHAGLRQDLVQGGGGNSSVKIDDRFMYIKASGFCLADVSAAKGFSKVDYKMIYEMLKNPSLEIDEKEIIFKSLIDGQKPSIETFLHCLTNKYTLHTHPIAVNILACRQGGMDELKKLFPQSIIIKYQKPGLPLSKILFEEIKTSKNTEIVFLANHGLIVSADGVQEVIDITEKIISIIEKYLDIENPYKDITVLDNLIFQNGFDFGNIYQCFDGDIVEAAKSGMWKYDFCPDCIVYCGTQALVIDKPQDIDDYVKKFGNPIVVWFKGNCFICCKTFEQAKQIERVLSFSAQINKENVRHKINYLTDDEKHFLLNWDDEKYRRQLSSK